MKKKVLVTGGTGYIGSHTVVELIENGFEVIILDNLSNSKIDVLDGIKKITGIRPLFEKIDLCNKNEVDFFFNKYHDFESIIHFAAFKAVGESVEFPLMYYYNNMLSIINLLEAIKNSERRINFVFSSSCAVYGNSEILPVSEDLSFGEPTSPYGNTKQFAEKILRDTVRECENFKTIALRYFNPIGAHPSGFIGEAPLKTYNLIPILTETATGKRKEMYVFGNDYNTIDGSCVRDYIHVVDIAKAHIIALKRIINNEIKSDFEFFNLGLGRGFSVFEVIKSFEKVSQKSINYKVVNKREGDVAEVYASTKLANSVLGWKAQYNLDEMLFMAWKWESEYRNY
jgi:UDP-glucose 4-epimerase